MSYRIFLDEIKKGLPSLNYILTSSDPFLHTEAVSLIKSMVPPEERDFSFHSFDLLGSGSESITFDYILDVLNSVPFFGGRKYVAVENFQKLPKKDIRKLEHYLQDPSGSSSMILLNLGTLKKEFKEKFKGIKQILLDISEKDIPLWLKQKAKSKGLDISDNVADYLLGIIGPDLGMLSSELDKCTLIGKPVIDKKDIMEIIEGKRTYNAFDLVNAINARDTEKVFRIYGILKETEEPYSLLGALNWQFGRFMSGKNTPQDKKHNYNVFSILNKADVDIKSSGSFYPVELLLVKLLRITNQR